MAILLSPQVCRGEDPVFSGPQKGERLAPFRVAGVYDERAGGEFDPVAEAGDKPSLLVFVHKLTRPGMALTRALMTYAESLENKPVHSTVVWLDDDKAQAERYLTMARRSLNLDVPVGISVDGGEGPGAYGLNRNVELTILVADQGKVTANFALVQPSVTEGPTIAGELAKLVGAEPPTDAEFEKLAYPGRGNRMSMQRRENGRDRAAPEATPQRTLRNLMQNLVRSGDDEKQTASAIEAIEKWVGDSPQRAKQLKRMASAALERGMGEGKAREQLLKWSDRKEEGSTAPRDPS